MPKKITFQEALERFEHRDDIILCEDGWNGWSKKSKFYDKVLNKEWLAIPESVYQGNRVPSERKGDIARKTNLEKYGVENYAQTDECKEKIKKTSLEKYGVENYAQTEEYRKKFIETHLNRYGVEHYSQTEEFKAKANKTSLEKYGVEYYSQTEEYKEKIKKTSLEKYGVEYYSQTDECKEKSKNTNLEKYGVEHYSQTEEYKKSFTETNLNRYGVENYAQTDEYKEKSKQTNLEKYGVEYYSQTEEYKEKKRKTSLEKYGVEHYTQTEEYREKSKHTNLEKYGVENYAKTEECKEKARKTSLEKYGVENYAQLNSFRHISSNRFIKETGEHLREWLSKQPVPKPSYHNLAKYFGNQEIYLSELETFISNYKDNKTSLEVLFENLMNVKHFNAKPNLTINYRPDFNLSENVFVNVDGLYWHSEINRDRDYHFEMRKDFETNNIRLFQFHENEIRNKPDIVRSILNNSLGQIETKIFARKCELKKVSHKDAILFLSQNHLMGSTLAMHIGLYFEDELVSLMSYKVKKNDTLKIERFCSKINTSVVGGFSKLLTYLEKNIDNINEIHNWVDLRYGTGNHLKSKGFVKIKETLGWKWTDGKETYNRLACRANMDERKLTESQHAEEKKWFKIYDAGQRLFIKIINKNKR
jgi:hypothetical protein